MDNRSHTQTLMQMDHDYIAGTYGRYDLVIAEGRGATCISDQGREYIDFTSGIGVNSLGFSDPVWVQAVTEQLAKLQHTSNLYYTEPQIKLARELTSRSGMAKVFFCNSGAEANEVAIKAARKFGSTEHGGSTNTIITLEDSFHGRTMATITATGQEHYHEYFTPFLDGFRYARANDPEHLGQLLDDSVCGIMIELIQGEGGVNNLNPEYVQKIQQICREQPILLIIDEVQTGIGRTGQLFAYQNYGLTPDIVTFAKGIGGGLPLGGALFSERACDILQPGDHGSTFGGNPAVCAGALAVLDRLDETLLADIGKKGSYIRERLAKHPEVSQLTGAGLMIGISLKSKDPKAVLADALEQGLLVLTAGERIRLLPPLTITPEELEQGLTILEACLRK